MIGTSLLHFRVTASLGAGGMGEVYRAEDAKLQREVAIKVLPREFALSGERMERFEREARLLAALNHPKIAAIYQVEEADGIHFLVMELVEGETLEERLRAAPLSDQAIYDLAGQIAEALEFAHERGIVHRDLKPSNIKLTPDGQIKILDFGLAKALEVEASHTHSMSPTMTAGATRAGVLLGTAAYMSPEQARGLVVDKRTDIWAFGCVLFEMITRQPVFARETVGDTLAAVLEHEPDWETLPDRLPGGVRLLLERCLRKDRRRRLRDIGDAHLELEERNDRTADVAVPRGEPAGSRRLLVPALVGLALAIPLATWVWSRGQPPRSGPRPLSRWSLQLDPPTQLSIGGRVNPLAISPDGRRIVFVAEKRGARQLYLRDLDAIEARPVHGTDGARNPFFSPDGAQVGFFSGTSMKVAPLDGGAPRVLVQSPLDDLGSSWGADGSIVFARYGAGLARVPAEGGDPEILTTLDYEAGETQHRWPQVLPDGKTVLFTVGTSQGSAVGLLSLETGERRTLSGISDVSRAHYLEGVLLLGQTGGLRALRFDLETGAAAGSPVAVPDDVAVLSDLGNALFAVSDAGSIVFVPGFALADSTSLVWVDRQGTESLALDADATFNQPKISPDGQRVATALGGEIAQRQIWIFDLERGTRRIIASEASIAASVWTPDGRDLVFSSNRKGSWDLIAQSAQGSGEPRDFLIRDYEQWGGNFSPDGAWLAFYDVHPETGRDLLVLDVDTGEVLPYLVTRYSERSPRFSPDGSWIAYVSNETGRDEIYVESFPERSQKWTISTNGGTEAIWSRDGKELFYRQGEAVLAVPVALGETFAAGKPEVLFEGRYDTGVVGEANWDVSIDGRRFLLIKRDDATELVEIRVVLNWLDEVDQILGR